MSRILYVEDRRDVREVFERLLRKRGYDIVATNDIAVLPPEKDSFDLLIYGVQHYNAEDAKVVSQLVRERFGVVPSIATSPYLLPHDIERIQSAGYDCIVPEPIFFDRLETTIRACLTPTGKSDTR